MLRGKPGRHVSVKAFANSSCMALGQALEFSEFQFLVTFCAMGMLSLVLLT